MVKFTMHPETFRLAGYGFFWLMVIVAIIVSKSTLAPALINDSLLVKTFGYNNICVYFDFDPARTVAAMIWPWAEYVLVIYCVSNALAFYFLFKMGKLTKNQMYVVCTVSPIQALSMVYFRMIFVEQAPEGVGAHTAGFLNLQWGLCFIAMQNHWYNRALGVTPVPKWADLGYVVGLFCLTLLKQIVAISSIQGNPIWCVNTATCPTGARAAQGIDVTWMIMAAVIPAILAYRARLSHPPLTFYVRSDKGAKEAIMMECKQKIGA